MENLLQITGVGLAGLAIYLYHQAASNHINHNTEALNELKNVIKELRNVIKKN